MFDTKRAVGGMNHFLLPGDNDGTGGIVQRHGVYLMELLINGLLKKGVDKRDLNAKIFGGANTVAGIVEQIGEKNIQFAKRFLQAEGIPIVGESVGGNSGRRIQFWPSSGRARQAFIAAPADEMKIQKALAATPVGGDVELF
nr:chemotaxis protein CheD [Aestuariivirga litoralis]